MHDENNGIHRGKEVNSVVKIIKTGSDKHGLHVIGDAGLELAWGLYQPRPDHEKRLHVENFAEVFGFQVYLNSSLNVAIFREAI